MNPLIELLNFYDPKPQYAQFAFDGNWENAVRIEFSNDNDYVTTMLGQVDSSIAGEIFYKLNDDRVIFFGLRYSSTLKVNSPKDFMKIFIDIIKAASSSSLNDILIELGQQLNDNPSTLIQAKVNYVELGVEGNWKSIGSKVLRKTDEPTINQEIVKQLISENKSLLINTKNHTALEFAFSIPESWLGIQVSKKVKDEYITDFESVVELSNLF